MKVLTILHGKSGKIRKGFQSNPRNKQNDTSKSKNSKDGREKGQGDPSSKQIRILSFGGGVQTTYLLLRFPERYDYVIFADISKGDHEHGEKPKTYFLIENLIKPFCKEKGIEFITVTAKKSLWQYCEDEKLIPVTFPRWCTDKFKIRPIHKFIRNQLKATAKNPVFQDIGFSYDEALRSKVGDRVKYVKTDYPLIDLKITREQCIKFLKENYPEFQIEKSGCWFCVFAKKKEFQELKLNNPDKWNELVNLEKNGSKFPKITLKGKPLEKFIGDNKTLDEFQSCSEGYCFN